MVSCILMCVIYSDLGAKVELMSPNMLKAKFPWLKTEDLLLGSYGKKTIVYIYIYIYIYMFVLVCVFVILP